MGAAQGPAPAAWAARPLALHHLTVAEVAPAALPALARAAGFTAVCLFAHVPATTLTGGGAGFPVVTPAACRDLAARLADAAIGVTNLEFFPVTPATPFAAYEPALAVGAALGARRIVAHVHDPEPARAVAALGQLAERAAAHGLGVGLEFLGLTPGCASLATAAWFVAQVGRADLGLAVDMLHLVRTGGTAEALRALPPAAIAYAQLCDGTDPRPLTDERREAYRAEALDRLLPGDGCFPLTAMLRALPPGIDIDLEVPRAHARAAAIRARALLAAARP